MVENIVCAMRRGHPSETGRFDLETFRQQEFVSVSSRPDGPNILSFIGGWAGQNVKPKIHVQSYMVAVEIIQRTDAVVVFGERLAKRFDLSYRDLPFELARDPVWLSWHRDRDDDPSNRWLRDLILKHLRGAEQAPARKSSVIRA